jgi:hypothetical protein
MARKKRKGQENGVDGQGKRRRLLQPQDTNAEILPAKLAAPVPEQGHSQALANNATSIASGGKKISGKKRKRLEKYIVLLVLIWLNSLG